MKRSLVMDFVNHHVIRIRHKLEFGLSMLLKANLWLGTIASGIGILLAPFAVMPVYQWYLEAPDRDRERLVQEVVVLQTCLDPKVREHTKNRLNWDAEDRTHGAWDMPPSWFEKVAKNCSELGFDSNDLYPDPIDQ